MNRCSKDQNGFLHVSLSLVCVISVITGLSLWSLLHHWKNLVDTQLRLDHCTGQMALDLKNRLEKVESINAQMIALRKAIQAAMIVPSTQATVPPLQAALQVEYALQELQQVQWNARALQWAASVGCGEKQDFGLPIAPLTWDRPPPDAIGENPIDPKSIADRFRVVAFHPPRNASAITERTNNDSWFTHWGS